MIPFLNTNMDYRHYELCFRNTVIGMTATCARVGGILAPFCAQLDHIFPDLNLIVLGMASLLASILTFKGINCQVACSVPMSYTKNLCNIEY